MKAPRESRPPARRGRAGCHLGVGLFFLLGVGLLQRAVRGEPEATGLELFEKRIRPVLEAECHRCHAAERRPKGGLALDTPAGLLKGGASGAAIIPHQVDDSLLIQAIRHSHDELKMPPKAKLPDEVIADFELWVRSGAPYPQAAPGEAEHGQSADPWWSLIPPDALPPAEMVVEEAIDRLLEARLAAAGVTPAPRAGDANLIRRLTLDLAGRVPAASEVRAYVESEDPDKRAKLADRLLDSPASVRHRASVFDALLMEGGRTSLRDYLTRAFGEGRPWRRIFRDLLEVQGSDAENAGADAFLKARVSDTDKLTNDVSAVFFGVNISCAMCHDHPHVSSWSQERYFGMKSFFNRTFESGGFIGERDHGLVSFKTRSGETHTARLMFLTGRVLEEAEAPQPTKEELEEEKKRLEELKKQKQPPPPPRQSRRARLIDAALEPGEEGYFARAIANRIWQRFFGRGLVMPLDQMHPANPPSHPELLLWLARDLIEHDYDLRRLERGIALSEAYARSSLWSDGERPPPDLFAAAQVRPLAPRQYAVSLRLASSDPRAFEALGDAAAFEAGLEALEKSAEGLARRFEEPWEGFQVSAGEALLLSNDDKLRRDLLSGGDRLVEHLLGIDDLRSRVENAIWCVLSRPPAAGEVDILTGYLEKRADRPGAACEQIVWSLLTGAEFRFNH
jgi:hypothetical protein